jgi:hypothetical protein
MNSFGGDTRVRFLISFSELRLSPGSPGGILERFMSSRNDGPFNGPSPFVGSRWGRIAVGFFRKE